MADNILTGDVTDMTELPQAPVAAQQEALEEVRRKAKYSRSKEFAELKAHMEARIEYYQKYLPGTSTPVTLLPEEERGKMWAVADLVIAELQQVIDGYAHAQEQVKEANE